MAIDDIERKDHVPDEHRTPDRDEVADYIEEEIINENRLPMTKTGIADEVDYSRQHVDNVLEYYFQPKGRTNETTRITQSGSGMRTVNISVPDDVPDAESYLRGYIDGYLEYH